jgi:DNA-binding HxlR family transcriptional regulator
MKWQEIGGVRCSVARTLSVVGDRWTLLILRDAFLGVRRFDDFQKSLGLTRHRLADRLKKLVEHEILERRRYQERPEKGIDLYPILIAIAGWGDRWMAGDEGPPLVYRHRGCGRLARPALHCPECGETVGARDITPLPGPGIGGPE